MPEYAAFLRGINVGGHRITSADLRARFKEIGFRDVNVFQASGNVVFDRDGGPVAKIGARIEKGLEAALGYDVAVFLRKASEVRAIARQQPFAPAVVEASRGKLQVAMLLTRPEAGEQEEVLALGSEEDRLAFGDRELYWLPSGGLLESALDLKAIGKVVGATTVRTKGTVERLAAKHFGA